MIVVGGSCVVVGYGWCFVSNRESETNCQECLLLLLEVMKLVVQTGTESFFKYFNFDFFFRLFCRQIVPKLVYMTVLCGIIWCVVLDVEHILSPPY